MEKNEQIPQWEVVLESREAPFIPYFTCFMRCVSHGTFARHIRCVWLVCVPLCTSVTTYRGSQKVAVEKKKTSVPRATVGG